MTTGSANTQAGSAHNEANPAYGWKAYDRQFFLVPAVFLLPVGVGFVAALGAEKWVPDQSLTLALTTSVALLAVLHLSDFVEILSGHDSRGESPSPTSGARQVTGGVAFIAILTILAHVLIQDVNDVDGGAPEVIAADLGHALRSLVRFSAVLLTGASIGMWVATRWTRSLLTLPDPPVQPSTRLSAGALDLVVPGFVLLILIRRFDYWFDTWDTSVVATTAVVGGWQLLLTRASCAGGRRILSTRILETNWKGDRLNAPPGWLRSALRASIHGFVVGLPVGVWLGAFMERAELPPGWLVAWCPVPFLVLALSIPAHPSGQALHDLLCGTVVLPAQDERSGSRGPELRVWAPCW